MAMQILLSDEEVEILKKNLEWERRRFAATKVMYDTPPPPDVVAQFACMADIERKLGVDVEADAPARALKK